MKHIYLLFCFCIPFGLFAVPSVISDFIKVDQFGYRPDAQKVCVISDPQIGFNAALSFTPGVLYEVRRWSDDVCVFFEGIVPWNNGAIHAQSGDKVWWFDFSDLDTPGSYYIWDPTNLVGSSRFEIADDVYTEVLRTVVKMFYLQRCGVAKEAAHAHAWNDVACHNGTNQDQFCLQADNPAASTAKDLSGGWHDAGDYNKYVNFTYSVVHNLLFAYEQNPTIWSDNFGIPETGNGIPDLLDELKFELDWLLKMQLSDGSCLMKVSVRDFASDSPASADDAHRFYGEAQSSATRVIASLFAHAAMVYGSLGDPSMNDFADILESRAELAWDWLSNNPGTSDYDNEGFDSANPEMSAEEQEEVKTGAAAMLYALTGSTEYRDYFDANYEDIRPYAWGFWYPFQNTIQDIMLYYANLPTATPMVAANIEANCIQAVTTGNPDLLDAWNSHKDAYRAQLGDSDYVWGSNQWRTNMGNIMYNMYFYGMDPTNADQYLNASESYIHAMHGVNPLNFVMMTHMDDLGAENSARQMYHAWFGFGTDYSHADSSLIGPPPGYITGGFNPDYSPADQYCCILSPPQNQPIQKSYKDWNVGFPENSWEVTEPAIYYQAAYIKLLSKFLIDAIPLPVNLLNFEARLDNQGAAVLHWKAEEENLGGYFIERRNAAGKFEELGWQKARGNQITASYTFKDVAPQRGTNYYRLRIEERDGSYEYSKIVSVTVNSADDFQVFPNPASDQLNLHIFNDAPADVPVNIKVWNSVGSLVHEEIATSIRGNGNIPIPINGWATGLYFLEVELNGRLLKQRVVKR